MSCRRSHVYPPQAYVSAGVDVLQAGSSTAVGWGGDIQDARKEARGETGRRQSQSLLVSTVGLLSSGWSGLGLSCLGTEAEMLLTLAQAAIANFGPLVQKLTKSEISAITPDLAEELASSVFAATTMTLAVVKSNTVRKVGALFHETVCVVSGLSLAIL